MRTVVITILVTLSIQYLVAELFFTTRSYTLKCDRPIKRDADKVVNYCVDQAACIWTRF